MLATNMDVSKSWVSHNGQKRLTKVRSSLRKLPGCGHVVDFACFAASKGVLSRIDAIVGDEDPGLLLAGCCVTGSQRGPFAQRERRGLWIPLKGTARRVIKLLWKWLQKCKLGAVHNQSLQSCERAEVARVQRHDATQSYLFKNMQSALCERPVRGSNSGGGNLLVSTVSKGVRATDKRFCAHLWQ